MSVEYNDIMAGLQDAELCKWRGVTGKKFHLVFKGEHYFTEKGRVSAGKLSQVQINCRDNDKSVRRALRAQRLPGEAGAAVWRQIVKVLCAQLSNLESIM